MSIFYVRKSGNDGSAGTSAGAAWLTIDKAANTVAAGDTVYIGAGVYRELVTMDTSGSSGNLIKFVADVTGAQTGDGGLVIISAYNSATTSPARSNCLVFQDKQFIEWTDIVFVGGDGGAIISASTASNVAYEGVTFTGCVFINNRMTGNSVHFNLNTGGTPSTTGLTFDKCFFWLADLRIQFDNHASAAQNFKVSVTNCWFGGYYNSSFNVAVFIERETDNTHKSGGFNIYNCTIIGSNTGVLGWLLDSTTYPLDVKNCLIARCPSNGIERFSGTSVRVTSDYNAFTANGANVSGVTIGSNSKSAGEYFIWGGIADLPLYRRLGWSPYKPWEPITGSGLIDIGSATPAPSDDLFGSTRPMGRNVDDIGPVEARTRPAQESSTIHGGTYAANFQGAGYYDIMRAVDAASTTISVYCRKDANYTGSEPKLEVVNIPGVADQSDSLTVAAGNWEQLSVTFTPTSAGWCRIRLWSYDTSSNGKCFFDDLV